MKPRKKEARRAGSQARAFLRTAMPSVTDSAGGASTIVNEQCNECPRQAQEQVEMFDLPGIPPRLSPVVKREVQVIDGVQISILREDGKIIRLQSLGDHPIDAKITQQQDGRSYCTIPGYGTMPKTKNEAAVLSWFATACRSLEITRILRTHNKQDAELLQELEPLLETQKQLAAEKDSAKSPRVRKKDLQPATNLIYANPFQEYSTNFAKGPPWLLERPDRDLKPIEKLIYARLLFPLPPICRQWDQELGVIIELDQDELAKSLGTSRCTINRRLISLQFKGWIKCDGEPGAKLTVRFLWKDGMPESCKHGFTGSRSKPVASVYRTCATGAQQLVRRVHRTCATGAQVSKGIEKRETEREEREDNFSLPHQAGKRGRANRG